MKKQIILSMAALALMSCSQQKNDTAAAAQDAAAVQPTDSVTAGQFQVVKLSDCILHIYLTDDEMADASYIIEGPDSLVTLEQPLFKVNADNFDAYLAKLGKPVAQRIADFHLGNTGSESVIMPQGMPEVVKGPEYSGMMSHFAQVYGDALVDLPTGATDEVAFDSTVMLAGVPFTFLKGADNDFPGANILIGSQAVYSHWSPARTHINSLYAATPAAIDARLAELNQILATGATVFVGGHGAPATADDVRFRIEYLNRIKSLMAANTTAQDFAKALTEAYPELPGADQVESLAESLYK